MERLVKTFASISTFIYEPQYFIPLHHNGNTISVSAGGTLSNNTYHWYRNNNLLNSIIGDSTLQITQAGNYYAAITNSIAKELTLYSDTVVVTLLPVSLISFSAQKQNNTTLINWQTAYEVNNNYFSIERSSDTKLFYSIGHKRALNNINKADYFFIDNKPLNGLNYYRLKQFDIDGKFTYSKIVSVDFSNNLATFAVYPNPTSKLLYILLPSINETSDIVLYDATGKKVLHEQLESNISVKQIDISSFPAGVYYVMLEQSGKKQTVKLVKK